MVKPSGQNATDTKTRILDAADEIFVRHGIDGARMQEIADHAGVNKALLHYYFRSKADLARAVWLRIDSSFVPGIFQLMASHPYLLAFAISEVARHPDLVDD